MTYIPEKLRLEVIQNAGLRCEYCHLHQNYAYHTHEIDHIYAEKHGGTTALDNLCLSCADCNRHKGSNLCSLDPDTGDIVSLYHPQRHKWGDHFSLNENGFIDTHTPEGRVIAKVLKFNRFELIVDRQRLIKLGQY